MLDGSMNPITITVLMDLTPGLDERRENLEVRVRLPCKKVDSLVLNCDPT